MNSTTRTMNSVTSLLHTLRLGIFSVLIAGFILTGCDLNVFDPSTVEDSDLDDPDAIAPLVAGVEGDFAVATTASNRPGGTIGAGAFLTDELVHVGQWGGMQEWNVGRPDRSTSESATRWSQASRARWVAEDAIRRITEIQENHQVNAASEIAQVTMWAGFANRVMGDTFCEAVIDGGPLEPSERFHERAEEFFTDAISRAEAAGVDQYRTAAYAGRAQSRIMLGDWSGAISDAEMVSTDFVHVQRQSENTTREANGVFRTVVEDNQSSVWGTPFSGWGMDLSGTSDDAEGDPRVPYEIEFADDEGGEMATGGDNRRPLWRPLKYSSRADDVPVVKGTEMRLIEAEAALLDGNTGTAVDKINEVRSHHGLGGVSAGSSDEAWELLQKERGIELWLEGRRLPDLRRWQENPGTVPFEVVREVGDGEPENDVRRNVLNIDSMCLPVSENERLSNPNI